MLETARVVADREAILQARIAVARAKLAVARTNVAVASVKRSLRGSDSPWWQDDAAAALGRPNSMVLTPN